MPQLVERGRCQPDRECECRPENVELCRDVLRAHEDARPQCNTPERLAVPCNGDFVFGATRVVVVRGWRHPFACKRLEVRDVDGFHSPPMLGSPISLRSRASIAVAISL